MSCYYLVKNLLHNEEIMTKFYKEEKYIEGLEFAITNSCSDAWKKLFAGKLSDQQILTVIKEHWRKYPGFIEEFLIKNSEAAIKNSEAAIKID